MGGNSKKLSFMYKTYLAVCSRFVYLQLKVTPALIVYSHESGFGQYTHYVQHRNADVDFFPSRPVTVAPLAASNAVVFAVQTGAVDVDLCVAHFEVPRLGFGDWWVGLVLSLNLKGCVGFGELRDAV
ncbi:hypothetical protein VTL71DRAFT_9829 [Oculimacula yallundae]|uniref:Uncharacterized protein n=1 Tax=Oculimacula yallundae TaxID=86028 RepID=A0ABR4BQL1_9HELO